MKIAAVIFLVVMCFLNHKSFISTGSLLFVTLCVAAICFSSDKPKETQ